VGCRRLLSCASGSCRAEIRHGERRAVHHQADPATS